MLSRFSQTPLGRAFGLNLLAASGGGGGGPAYSAEATALFARMTTPPDATRKGLINTLIGALKAGATSGSNIWSKLDILYVTAAADSQAGSLDWKNLGGVDAFDLATSSGSPIWSTDANVALVAGDVISTGFSAGVNGVALTSTQAHLMAWIDTMVTPGSDQLYIGETGRCGIEAVNSAGNFVGRVNSSLTRTFQAGLVPLSGMFLATVKPGATTLLQGYINGTQGTSGDQTRGSAFTSSNIAGFTGYFGGISFKAASWGAALTAAEVTDYYNALNTYLTAIAPLGPVG